MNITDRIVRTRDATKQRLAQERASRAAGATKELEVENRLLRDEVGRNRAERAQLLDVLADLRLQPDGHGRRVIRLLRVVAVGGTVYMISRNEARERITDWVSAARDRSRRFAADAATAGSDVTHRVGDTVEHAGRKLEGAGKVIERSAQRAAS